MKNNPKGRRYIGRGVSLDPELRTMVEAELERLWPGVRGFSHYVQLLLRRQLDPTMKDRMGFLDLERQSGSTKESKHCAKGMRKIVGGFVSRCLANPEAGCSARKEV